MSLPLSPTVAQTVHQLTERLRALEVAERPATYATISSGTAALDRLLPERGLRRGCLVEWLSATAGSGAAGLAMRAARQAAVDGGAVVVIDRSGSFYPPAALLYGITAAQLVVVRPANDADAAWVWDQALRSPAVAAVWGWPGRCDGRALRRWQLAAEASGTLGLLLRPGQVQGEPSWAELRLLVTPQVVPRVCGSGSSRRLQVRLLRARGGLTGTVAEVTLSVTGEVSPLIEDFSHERIHIERIEPNHSPGRLHLATQLAHPTVARRARRA